jgi:preprotein translocase subunit SecE
VWHLCVGLANDDGEGIYDMTKKDEKKAASKAVAKKSSKKRGKFFKEVVSELKKVSWPSKKELMNYTLAVLAVIAVFTVIIFVIDSGLGAIYKFVIS